LRLTTKSNVFTEVVPGKILIQLTSNNLDFPGNIKTVSNYFFLLVRRKTGEKYMFP
jgi:hypothetical protein